MIKRWFSLGFALWGLVLGAVASASAPFEVALAVMGSLSIAFGLLGSLFGLLSRFLEEKKTQWKFDTP